MAHPEFRELIELRAEGELDATEAARLDEHLAECAACRQALGDAEREVGLLHAAYELPDPPVQLSAFVLNRVREHRTERRRRALVAGIAANLITAALLVLLSLGGPAPLLLMVLVALAGAVIWGALKGIAFAATLRYLPSNVLARGLLYGLALWVVSNALLGAAGGPTPSISFSVALVGSLAHYLLYGLLLSWLFAELAPGGGLRGLTRSRAMAACIILAVAGGHLPSQHLRNAALATASPTPTATSISSGTPTAFASTATVTSTTTPAFTPTATPTATPSPTATVTLKVTSQPTPLPTITPHPSSTRGSPLQQVHAILPAVVHPNGYRAPRVRVREIVTLLDFL